MGVRHCETPRRCYYEVYRRLPYLGVLACSCTVSFGLGTLLNSLNITFQILTIPTICGLVPIPLLSHFISVRKSLIV